MIKYIRQIYDSLPPLAQFGAFFLAWAVVALIIRAFVKLFLEDKQVNQNSK